MTDPITCPECDGAKGEWLAGLFLACRFCHGRGVVGGEHEPAEAGQEPPEGPPAVWEDRRWPSSSWATQGLCSRCLGARKVSSVHRETRTMVMVDCPICSDPI